MPGPLLHLGATVLCNHGGQAMPSTPNPRVLVSGQPVATMAAPYMVAGCAFVPPAGNGPCVTAQFMVGSTRVLSTGQPLLLFDSMATCVPTGTPTITASSQTRVLAI